MKEIMKIISGKLKGLNIVTKDKMSYKPLTGMIKEAIFSILTSGKFIDLDTGDSVLKNAVTVDLFGGTGAITFEAISRGVSKGIIIERDDQSFKLLKQNTESLKITEQIELIRGDATALPRAKEKCSMAFLDPPFNKDLVMSSVKSLVKQGWLTDDAILVIRTHPKEKFDINDVAEELFSRKYNNSFLYIYRIRRV